MAWRYSSIFLASCVEDRLGTKLKRSQEIAEVQLANLGASILYRVWGGVQVEGTYHNFFNENTTEVV
jgi:hypothetical protein